MNAPQAAGELPVRAPGVLKVAGLVELQKLVQCAVHHPDVLLIRGDVNVPGIANVRPLVEELAVLVEDLHAAVPTVGDVQPPVIVDRHGVHR